MVTMVTWKQDFCSVSGTRRERNIEARWGLLLASREGQPLNLASGAVELPWARDSLITVLQPCGLGAAACGLDPAVLRYLEAQDNRGQQPWLLSTKMYIP